MHDNVVESPQLSGQGKQKIEWVKCPTDVFQGTYNKVDGKK